MVVSSYPKDVISIIFDKTSVSICRFFDQKSHFDRTTIFFMGYRKNWHQIRVRRIEKIRIEKIRIEKSRMRTCLQRHSVDGKYYESDFVILFDFEFSFFVHKWSKYCPYELRLCMRTCFWTEKNREILRNWWSRLNKSISSIFRSIKQLIIIDFSIDQNHLQNIFHQQYEKTITKTAKVFQVINFC